jgi:hypothetical protein
MSNYSHFLIKKGRIAPFLFRAVFFPFLNFYNDDAVVTDCCEAKCSSYFLVAAYSVVCSLATPFVLVCYACVVF